MKTFTIGFTVTDNADVEAMMDSAVDAVMDHCPCEDESATCTVEVGWGQVIDHAEDQWVDLKYVLMESDGD